MAASSHQAKVILDVYLQRGLAALRKLEAGQLEDGLSLCQWRAAAFHNFRSLDANLRECGVDLALDKEVQKLWQQLEQVNDRLALVLNERQEEAKGELVQAQQQRKAIGKFHSGFVTQSYVTRV